MLYFTDYIVKSFLWDIFLKLSVWIKCKLTREVWFKLSFILYNMDPLGFNTWIPFSLSEIKEWEYDDEDELRDLLLRIFVLCFLFFFFFQAENEIMKKKMCGAVFLYFVSYEMWTLLG